MGRTGTPTPRRGSRKRNPSPLLTSKVAIAQLGASTGEPLHPDIQDKVEHSFGEDLSNVRVHPNAVAQTKPLGARAVTVGNQIFLGPGESRSNLPLLAHETAHVVQQGQGIPTAQPFSNTTDATNAHEREAHAASQAAVEGRAFAVQARTTSPRPQALFDPLEFLA